MLFKNWVVTKSPFLSLGGVVRENFDFDPLISNFLKAQRYDCKMT